MVGWIRTCTAIIRHSDADVWVMAERTSSFDYGTAIPAIRLQEVRTVAQVAWAKRMLLSWTYWKLPNGKQQNVEMVGLDDSLVGGPWTMYEGEAREVLAPERVIIDTLYQDKLGVSAIGEEAEILGRRAIVGAKSTGVRTLTVAPIVFTSVENARQYDPWHSGDEITYVIARAADGVSATCLRDAIKADVPAVEVLTSDDFSARTARFWMIETGLGVTVVLTAGLGVTVGMVIISQTLYAVTSDNLGNYAALLALGFGRWSLVRIVIVQATVLGCVGICVGTALFLWAIKATANTPIPIETTPAVFGGIATACLLSCWCAAVMSIRAIWSVDPITVFRN